jgi:hypothetical protein
MQMVIKEKQDKEKRNQDSHTLALYLNPRSYQPLSFLITVTPFSPRASTKSAVA